MSNRSVEESKGSSEGEADRFRVGTELTNNIPLSIVHGNELLDTGHDIILIFGLGSKNSEITTEVINER